jgi:hypothetical protein
MTGASAEWFQNLSTTCHAVIGEGGSTNVDHGERKDHKIAGAWLTNGLDLSPIFNYALLSTLVFM